MTALSALLERLSAYPMDQQGDEYRNPDGAHLGLTDRRAIETQGQHGVNAYGQLDAAVWRDERFHAAAPDLAVLVPYRLRQNGWTRCGAQASRRYGRSVPVSRTPPQGRYV